MIHCNWNISWRVKITFTSSRKRVHSHSVMGIVTQLNSTRTPHCHCFIAIKVNHSFRFIHYSYFNQLELQLKFLITIIIKSSTPRYRFSIGDHSLHRRRTLHNAVSLPRPQHATSATLWDCLARAVLLRPFNFYVAFSLWPIIVMNCWCLVSNVKPFLRTITGPEIHSNVILLRLPLNWFPPIF